MKQEIKKRWIEALRSGKYKQGTGNLKNGNSFCCLGVLCDLHRETFGGKWVDVDGMEQYDEHDTVLPMSIVEWAEMPSRNPSIKYGGPTLAEYNDLHGKSFEEIADIIEKHL